MATTAHELSVGVWAYYYEGRFSHFCYSDVDMSERAGWIHVKNYELLFEYDCSTIPAAKLAVQLEAEIKKMRATAEAAINEKVKELQKLLAITNEVA